MKGYIMSETWLQLTRRIWGETLTDDQADALLWSCTAFPCIGQKLVEKQLESAKLKSNSDFSLAMKQADDDMRQAMSSTQDILTQ
jgi:hypothetical protein